MSVEEASSQEWALAARCLSVRSRSSRASLCLATTFPSSAELSIGEPQWWPSGHLHAAGRGVRWIRESWIVRLCSRLTWLSQGRLLDVLEVS